MSISRPNTTSRRDADCYPPLGGDDVEDFQQLEMSGASTESMKASISSGSFHDAALNW